jgi:hypothetical protein
MPRQKPSVRVQTTLRLPKKILEEARLRVARRNSNLNDFIVNAISAYLAMLRRRELDASFAGMAHDPAYRQEAEEVAASFQESDWEALAQHEKDSEPAHASR